LRRISDGEGNIPPIVVLLLVLLLLPVFLLEGYLLMETAEQIEVEDVYVDNYKTEIEETGDITKIEMDLKIDIRNSAARNLKIEKLEYDLMIMPDDGRDIEFDQGEVKDITVRGGDVTTISMPIENEDEDDIGDIQDYILEEEGEVEAVVEVHVPLLQIYVDFPITTVSEQLGESFDYEPILESYEIGDEVEDEDIKLEENGPDSDYDLIVPYYIKTNENEFISEDIEIEVTMTDGENIEEKDTIDLEIGGIEEGNFKFGLDENETEDIFTEDQTFTFTPEIKLEDFSFQHDPHEVDSQATLEKYEIGDEVEGENVTLVGDEEDNDQLLKVPYNIETAESEYFEGEAEVKITMTDREDIEDSDSIDLEIGESDKGNFIFRLDEDETEEVFTEDQTFTFTPEIKWEDFSFQLDSYEVDSPAALEEYEVDSENSTLEEAGDNFESEYILKTPYEIKTNETELISEDMTITPIMTDDNDIYSEDNITFEIGDDKEGYIIFELEDEDIEQLLNHTQTIDFSSEIDSEEDISIQREHDTVKSQAMLVKYEIYGEAAELNESKNHLEVPYHIETNETAFFEEGGNISVTTMMESEDENITSSTYFEIEVGDGKIENLTFDLTEEEVQELAEEDKTLQFTSDVERERISFEYDHPDVEWDPDGDQHQQEIEENIEKISFTNDRSFDEKEFAFDEIIVLNNEKIGETDGVRMKIEYYRNIIFNPRH